MHLTVEDYERIRAFRAANPTVTYKTIAAKYGCSTAHIAQIISGRVGKAYNPAPKPAPKIAPKPSPLISWTPTKEQLTARR